MELAQRESISVTTEDRLKNNDELALTMFNGLSNRVLRLEEKLEQKDEFVGNLDHIDNQLDRNVKVWLQEIQKKSIKALELSHENSKQIKSLEEDLKKTKQASQNHEEIISNIQKKVIRIFFR